MYMSDDDTQNSNIDCTKDHILDLDGISNIELLGPTVQPFNPKGAGVSGWISFEHLHNKPNYGFLHSSPKYWGYHLQQILESDVK